VPMHCTAQAEFGGPAACNIYNASLPWGAIAQFREQHATSGLWRAGCIWMRWSIIRLIWLRELRDQLRDRGTMVMIAVLPSLLYPVLGLAVLQFALSYAEQTSTVGLVAPGDSFPSRPQLTGRVWTWDDLPGAAATLIGLGSDPVPAGLLALYVD